jgi:single-stranded DNA-binding protein
MLQTTVILEGNIAADIEVTYTTAGKPVVRFQRRTPRRQPRQGRPVLVVGNLITDAWDDKDSGDKRPAQRVLVVGGRPFAAVRHRHGPQGPTRYQRQPDRRRGHGRVNRRDR